MSTYAEKIDQAKSILAEHNEGADKKINVDKFITDLKNAGGTSDKALELCQWEDLEKVGAPPLVAKQLVKVFRVHEDKGFNRNRILTEARCQAMSPRELLESYDVRNHDNMVGKRLRELSGGKRCLVFAGGVLSVEASEKNINELRDNYGERDLVIIDGRPLQTYRVGEHPDQYAHENPLFADCLLRPDETCDHTNRSWSGIPESVRVLVYIAKNKSQELKINSIDDAHSVLDLLEKYGSPAARCSGQATGAIEAAVMKRYPKAGVMYEQMKQEGTLPSLRKRKGQPSNGKNDPFFTHKKF